MRRLPPLIAALAIVATACGAAPDSVGSGGVADAAAAPPVAAASDTADATTTTSASLVADAAAPADVPEAAAAMTAETSPPASPSPEATGRETPAQEDGAGGAGGPCPRLATPEAPDAVIRDVALTAIQLGSAKEPWRMDLGSELPSIAIGKRLLYLGLSDGTVVAIDPRTCVEEWRTAVAPAHIRVTAVDDYVVADGPDFLGALAADDGAVLWAGPQRFPWGVVFDVVEDVVLVEVQDFGLLGVDLETGNTTFSWAFENAPLRNVTADARHVYAGGKGIIARPLHGGKVVWESNADADLLTAADGYVFAAKDDGTVNAFDAGTGSHLWTRKLDGVTGWDGPAAVAHGEVHLLDYGARIHHLDLGDGTVVFQAQMVPGLTFPEFDDEMMLIQDRGVVRGIDLAHRERFGLETGANGVDRFTVVELFRNLAITLTWSETPAP